MAQTPVRRTITITATDRAALLEDMLGSLLSCALDGWHIYLAIEPTAKQDEMADLCQHILQGASFSVLKNTTRLGVRGNPLMALDRAFADGSDFNLCLEEDFLLASDALSLANWYIDNHKPNWAALNLLAGICGNAGHLSHPQYADIMFETRCFNSIGVGLTRADWDRARPFWRTPTTPERGGYADVHHFGWDWSLLAMIAKQPELCVIQPVAARCTHTGSTGIHCRPDYQEQAFGHVTLSPPYQGEYALRPGRDLPDHTRAHIHALNGVADRLREQILAAEPVHSAIHGQIKALYRKLKGAAS